MNQESENFDRLTKLLALKRCEQPPPGYFDRLTNEITARIAHEEDDRESLVEELGEGAGWLQKVWRMLEAQPALAGAFGVLVCGVMLTGIMYSQKLVDRPTPSGVAEQIMPSTPIETWAWNRATPPQMSMGSNNLIEPQIPPALFDGSAFKLIPQANTLPASFGTPQGN